VTELVDLAGGDRRFGFEDLGRGDAVGSAALVIGYVRNNARASNATF